MISDLQQIILSYMHIDEVVLFQSDESIKNIRRRKNEVNWDMLSENTHPGAIQIIREYILEHRKSGVGINKINWWRMSENNSPDAIKLCCENMNKIWWWGMSGNPHPDAIKLCRENMNKIDWCRMSRNTNPDAIRLIYDSIKKHIIHVDDLDWDYISRKPDIVAIKLCREFGLDKIAWWKMSVNPHPDALALCREHMNKVNWRYMVLNTNPDAALIVRKFINSDWNHVCQFSKHVWNNMKKSNNPEMIRLYEELRK